MIVVVGNIPNPAWVVEEEAGPLKFALDKKPINDDAPIMIKASIFAR